MNEDLQAVLEAVKEQGRRLDRISAQLAAIDAQLYRIRTQPERR